MFNRVKDHDNGIDEIDERQGNKSAHHFLKLPVLPIMDPDRLLRGSMQIVIRVFAFGPCPWETGEAHYAVEVIASKMTRF